MYCGLGIKAGHPPRKRQRTIIADANRAGARGRVGRVGDNQIGRNPPQFGFVEPDAVNLLRYTLPQRGMVLCEAAEEEPERTAFFKIDLRDKVKVVDASPEIVDNGLAQARIFVVLEVRGYDPIAP